MDLEALFGELAGSEPVEHRDYLTVPTEGVVYAAGSGVPLLGIDRVHQARGLHVVGDDASSAPINFIGVYLTLDDYFGDDIDPPDAYHGLSSVTCVTAKDVRDQR